MCTINDTTQLEGKMSHLTNRQLWLLQFEGISEWQKKMVQDECALREQAYVSKCRALHVPSGWWF
jgi:hypothetical protein